MSCWWRWQFGLLSGIGLSNRIASWWLARFHLTSCLLSWLNNEELLTVLWLNCRSIRKKNKSIHLMVLVLLRWRDVWMDIDWSPWWAPWWAPWHRMCFLVGPLVGLLVAMYAPGIAWAPWWLGPLVVAKQHVLLGGPPGGPPGCDVCFWHSMVSLVSSLVVAKQYCGLWRILGDPLSVGLLMPVWRVASASEQRLV